ncbi:MAG TPA: hypothetical protein VF701_22705 [Thermoanaerobaculia bacterium]
MAADYFQEIEAHFAMRRGTPFILNAKDWVLMKAWQTEGIPLPVVIEAIDSVFDKNEEKGGRKTINGLSYCRHAVKELWGDRRELQIGSQENAPEEGPELLLEALAHEVESVGEPAAVAFGSRIRALLAEKSVPRIEERLIELEEELIRTLLETSLEAKALEGEARTMSAGADAKTRERTEQANLRRLVRDRFGLPRLTLFG